MGACQGRDGAYGADGFPPVTAPASAPASAPHASDAGVDNSARQPEEEAASEKEKFAGVRRGLPLLCLDSFVSKYTGETMFKWVRTCASLCVLSLFCVFLSTPPALPSY